MATSEKWLQPALLTSQGVELLEAPAAIARSFGLIHCSNLVMTVAIRNSAQRF